MVASPGRFTWYDLVTTDMAAASAFYSEVMGWNVQDVSAPGSPYMLFSVGGTLVAGAVHLPAVARERGEKASWLGYVEADDLDVLAGRIPRLGGTVLLPPTDVAGISRFSVFADPQGAKLALMKWRQPVRQQPADLDALGRVGWHELFAADREEALAFYGELFGWQSAGADNVETGIYEAFSAGGQRLGGIFTKPPAAPAPFWLYYFNVSDIDAAVRRVEARGGRILVGPDQMPGGSWIVHCSDPQGATLALEGMRRPAIGYFARMPARESSAARSAR